MPLWEEPVAQIHIDILLSDGLSARPAHPVRVLEKRTEGLPSLQQHPRSTAHRKPAMGLICCFVGNTRRTITPKNLDHIAGGSKKTAEGKRGYIGQNQLAV